MARVLLVEDETAVLLFAEIVLEGLGHSTHSVSSQTQALALLETDDVDVLFTDIRLPESDIAGFELAKQARERHPALKVLYTTGQTIDDRMKALYVDGAAMLPKPYTDYALKGRSPGCSEHSLRCASSGARQRRRSLELATRGLSA